MTLHFEKGFSSWWKKIFFSNKRDIHALLKVSDTSWSEMMRFSFYELWIVTGEETTWSWSCSFVQTSEMKSYWVERWWKRRLNHQLVGYLWPTPAAVSLTLQEPKVCQKMFRHIEKSFSRENSLKTFLYTTIQYAIFFWYQIRQKSQRSHSDVNFAFLVQKLQILEKLEKWSIFISVSKLTIFSSKKFRNAFEFSRLN